MRKRYLGRWFVCFGILGIGAAFFVLYALSHQLVVANYALIFWPASMILLSDTDGFWFKALMLAISLCGNFFLYGLAGVVIGLVWNWVVRLFSQR